MHATRFLAIILIVLIFLAGSPSPAAQGSPPALDQQTIEALELALLDEIKSLMFYDAVLQVHGDVRPFSNVIRAEARHISALLDLYDQYGVETPRIRYRNTIAVPKSLKEACAVARQTEIDNAALYEELLDTVREDDIGETFMALASASLEHHLPAFQRCGGSSGRPGKGRQWGHGRRSMPTRCGRACP